VNQSTIFSKPYEESKQNFASNIEKFNESLIDSDYEDQPDYINQDPDEEEVDPHLKFSQKLFSADKPNGSLKMVPPNDLKKDQD
jgi:hypothetical protein